MEIKKSSDLRVYQLSLEYLEKIYLVAYTIPHKKLKIQLINSAEAIAPLIGEGFSRQRNPADAARYYELAMVESDEVVVHLQKAIILSHRFRKIPADLCQKLIGSYTTLSKQLNSLRNVWLKYSENPKKKSEN